jgi:hypothetical protein
MFWLGGRRQLTIDDLSPGFNRRFKYRNTIFLTAVSSIVLSEVLYHNRRQVSPANMTCQFLHTLMRSPRESYRSCRVDYQ